MINEIITGVSNVCYPLFRMSLVATVIMIVILGIKRIFPKLLSPIWQRIMWMLWIIALIVPIQWQSKLSIYNYVPIEFEKVQTLSYRDEYKEVEDTYQSKLQQHTDTNTNSKSSNDLAILEQKLQLLNLKSILVDYIIPAIWLFGMFTILILQVIEQIRFRKKIKNTGKVSCDENLLTILNACKKELKIRQKVTLVEQQELATPSIFGMIHMQILIPPNLDKLGEKQIRYIFLHELSHLKRKDNILVWLLSLLKIVYWYQPFIRMGIKQLRKDIEMDIDEMVVRNLSKKEQTTYCLTLLQVATLKQEKIVGTLGMSEEKSNLEKRIHMIKVQEMFQKNKIWITLVGIIVVIVILLCLLTAKYIDVPAELSVSSLQGKSAMCLLGEYQWKTMTETKVVDAQSPKDREYKNQNILTISTNQTISIYEKNSREHKLKELHSFAYQYYTESGEIVVLEEQKATHLTIPIPNQEGTYLLVFKIELKNGMAEYSVKVNVTASIKQLEQYQNTYIGDAPRVNQIIEKLQFAKYKSQIELHTKNEPYGLTITYKGINFTEEEVTSSTLLLFSLIPNVDTITYQLENNSITVSREKYSKLIPLTYPDVLDYLEEEKDDGEENMSHFTGIITQINGNSILVVPNRSESIRSTADKISISVSDTNVLKVGMEIKVFYSGYVMETYPAQVKASKVKVIARSKISELYIALLQKLMKEDEALNHEMQYIAIDFTGFKGDVTSGVLTEKEKEDVISFLESYLVEVKQTNLETLMQEEKQHDTGVNLKGILLTANVEKLEEDTCIIRMQKYRSNLGAILPKYECHYENGIWKIELKDTMIS